MESLWLFRLADASVRAVVLAMLAAVLALGLRRHPAAQHALWSLVLVSMLLLPALHPIVPAARIEVAADLVSGFAAEEAPATPAKPSPAPVTSPRNWLFLAWLAGAGLFALRLAAGWVMARRAFRRTVPLPFPGRVAECPALRVPVTTGLWRPRILLPPDWRHWPEAKLRIVLAHETSHALRRDPLVAFLAGLNRCLFWFHPLAWWLERRLALLAEQAADDAGVAASPDPASYARVVLEVASHMNTQQRRLLWSSTTMAGPVVARRIHRVLDAPATRRLTRAATVAFTLTAAALVWAAAAIDLHPAEPAAFGYRGNPQQDLTTEQVRELESRLALDPENSATRLQLLQHYHVTAQNDRRLPLLTWLIRHHPESGLFADIATAAPGNAAIDALWQQQVDYHPSDPQVLWNAARAFSLTSPRLDLMERAWRLDPPRYTPALALAYSSSLARGPADDVLTTLRASRDAALAGRTAREFIRIATTMAETGPDSLDRVRLRTLATELATRAQSLDSGDPQWGRLVEEARRIPDHADPAARARLAANMPSRIRIGGNVQKRQLITAPAPELPDGNTLHGKLRFQVVIGKDGKVTDAKLMSPDSPLAAPAEAAIRQYVYKPTLLNGSPMEVVTIVELEL